jgi:hypothetical protein
MKLILTESQYRGMLKQIKDYVITQAEMGKLCFQYNKNPQSIIDEIIRLSLVPSLEESSFQLTETLNNLVDESQGLETEIL